LPIGRIPTSKLEPSADPLDPHLHPLAAALDIHNDPFDNLANDLFAISIAEFMHFFNFLTCI